MLHIVHLLQRRVAHGAPRIMSGVLRVCGVAQLIGPDLPLAR